MLSRTAENLYWTSRYIERADSIARLLEVAYRINLIPNTSRTQSEWTSILETSGIKDEYILHYKDNFKKDKIENFLIFDEKNGSSIFECIRKARSNIKMVRTAVTLEVWNAVNSTFHDIEKFSEKKYSSRDLPGIIDFVKSRVNLIRGTIQNTQLIDDTFDFLSIGTYVERADFTARIIDVKYFILLPSSNYVGSQIDNFQWTLMLRSVSAYRGFKQTYGNNGVNHINIIEFLILDMTCPRSLMFSLDKISSHLTNLKKIYKKNSKAEEEICLIVKKFKKLSAKKILNIGLHEFLLEFIRKLYSVNSNLQNNYFFGKEK